MARVLETDTFTNKDISSAVAIGAYTSDAARLVTCRVLADQVSGSGDYSIYATVQVSGAGASYRWLPITTATAAAGVTSIMFTSAAVPLSSGDVFTVYLDGLSGDTTTPDISTTFYEHDYLRPAVADRTLIVSVAGYVGVDTLSTGVITSGAIQDGAITNAKVADDVDVNVKTMTSGAITSAALSSGAVAAIQAGLSTPASILDATITGTYTLRQLMRVTAAVLGGKVSGAETNSQVFRDISDTKDVVVASTDSYGNRILVTIDPT